MTILFKMTHPMGGVGPYQNKAVYDTCITGWSGSHDGRKNDEKIGLVREQNI